MPDNHRNSSTIFPSADEIRIGGVAVEFHEAYERLAPQFGWETQDASKGDWTGLPKNQKLLMEAVVRDLRDRGIISVPEPPGAFTMAPHPFEPSDEDFDTRCVRCGCKAHRDIHQVLPQGEPE